MSSRPFSEALRATRESLKRYYGSVLSRSEDLATNACCASGPPPEPVASALSAVHPRVVERFYGCGHPNPGALEEARVLDLGCGAGRDVYVLSQLVGPKGFVHGIDMTREQLEVARSTLAWHTERFGLERPNVAFHEGFIEDLGSLPVEPGSLDVVVSNCVVNLSPDKPAVLREVFALLRPGGEFHLADVLVDRRLPEAVRGDPLLYAECLGGAWYRRDFLEEARRAGFADPRVLEQATIEVRDPAIREKVGAARFASVTLRLFKLPGLEPACEDYGQVAVYRGGIAGSESLFRLDDHHWFEQGRPERVCGNTAAMLAQTRFARFFEVRGDRAVHYGVFSCEATDAARLHASGTATAPCC